MSSFAEVQAGIMDLHARYTDAVWRKDSQRFAECFTPDGEWRISGMVLQGREQIASTIAAILSRMNRVLFTYRVPVLHIGDEGVSTRVMIDEQVSWANGDTNIALGCYYERLIEQDGRWYFTWRLFEPHYRGPPDLTGTWFDQPDWGPPPALPPLDATTQDMARGRWQLSD